MRKLIAYTGLSLMALTVLVSCNSIGKKGNGHVVSETRNIQPFTELEIEGTFPVELTQTGKEGVVIVETDENLQNTIELKSEGEKLIIKMDDEARIRRSTKMKVTVNVKDLHSINFKSVGNLTTGGQLKLDSLEVDAESVGKMKLDIQAAYLRANLNSVGSTTLEGNVSEVRINNKSIGALSAYGLKAGTMMIHNTAVGSVEIYADSAFYIRSSAIGTLYYKGPGEVKELSSEGVGKVKKAD